MSVVFSNRSPLNPRNAINYLDSCAFNPDNGEVDAANKILALHTIGQVIVSITRSVKDELDRSKTPAEVRNRASGMFWVFAPSLTQDEKGKKELVEAIMIGNGKRDKYEADANHVFEVGRRGGYFITADKRILRKRNDLKNACSAIVCCPTEWLMIFQQTELMRW